MAAWCAASAAAACAAASAAAALSDKAVAVADEVVVTVMVAVTVAETAPLLILLLLMGALAPLALTPVENWYAHAKAALLGRDAPPAEVGDDAGGDVSPDDDVITAALAIAAAEMAAMDAAVEAA